MRIAFKEGYCTLGSEDFPATPAGGFDSFFIQKKNQKINLAMFH